MTKTRILLFILGVNVIAWGGAFIIGDLIEDKSLATSIVVPVIALGPLLMAVLLRLIFTESWASAGLKLNLKGNGKWYGLAMAFPLMVIGVVYLLGRVFGAGHWEPEISGRLVNLLKLSGVLALPMLFASIGEEFGWRGYLEPNLNRLGGSTLTNHVIVGVVWGVWHFPLLLMNMESISFSFLLMVIMGCVALAIVYGQIRIRTASVWPCVLLHAVANTFNVAFGASRLMAFDEGRSGLISLNSTSAAVTGTWILVAMVLLRSQKDYE